VLSTATCHRVPQAWIEQTRPGGRIVTPWASSYHNGALLHLDVSNDGTASGRFGGNVSVMWLFDPTTGSRTSITITPRATEFPIGQHGPRHLRDEATAAYDWWVSAGRPDYHRFGLTLTPDGGQHAWLDSPQHSLPTLEH
jgi:hypothetical protein